LAPVPLRCSVIPDDRAGFLETTVKRDDLASHRATVGNAGDRVHESAQAICGQCRIVVEQEQIPPSRDARGLVASSSEACIDGIAQDDRVVETFQKSVRVVPRSVVDDDELVRDVAVAQDGFETAIGVGSPVVG
jgi:hypothetical protein